jgi:hypothetical protein
MYKRFKSFFLLAIIILSSAVGVIALPKSAAAATDKLYIADPALNDAKASAYRVSLALCTTYDGGQHMNSPDGGSGWNVSTQDIISGDWYFPGSGQPETRIGYLIDPDNGQVECRNLFNNHPVATTLGFTSNIELACAIGFERTNKSDCKNGTGDFTAKNATKQKIYSGVDANYKNATGGTGFNGAQTYVMAASVLINQCKWTPLINYDDATPDQRQKEQNEQVKVVTGTGRITNVIYKASGNDGKYAFKNDENSFDYVTQTCLWMKDAMANNAAAYAAWVKDHPAQGGDDAGVGSDKKDEDKSSCTVAGVGWIICPIVNNLLAPITDATYSFVSTLLEVKPLTTTNDSQLYKAWSIMRDFANVAFVIAFLLIVFSQVTSIGISNYGLKKLLPRLIIAAILVNASFWICAIAVDLSNIVGGSMRSLLAGAAGTFGPPAGGASSTGNGALGWAGLAATGLAATGAALYIGLSALLPALIVVLFTILVVAFTLIIRQVLIVILIVIAPLAFVAYLLPNTESLFTRWRKLFGDLLLIYPIVGAIFGGSTLAATVITNAHPSGAGYTFAFQVMGAAVTVVPLILVPTLMKGAKALGGAFGGKLNSIINNPNRGPFDRARKGAEEYRKNREQLRDARALNNDSYRFGQSFKKRSARRQAVLAQRERNLNAARTGYVADTALSNDVSRTQRALSAVSGGELGGKTQGNQLLGQMAKGGGQGGQNAALAYALTQQGKIRADEIQAASAVLDHLDVNQENTRKLAMGEDLNDANNLRGSSETMRAAAMRRVANNGDVEGINQVLNHLSEQDQGSEDTRTRRQDFVDALNQAKEKPAYLSPGVLASIRQGDAKELKIAERDTDSNGNKISTSEQLIVNAINNNTYSPSKLASSSKDELKAIADVATNAAIQSNKAELKANAQTAQNDSRLANQIGKNREQFDRIHNLTP